MTRLGSVTAARQSRPTVHATMKGSICGTMGSGPPLVSSLNCGVTPAAATNAIAKRGETTMAMTVRRMPSNE